MIDQKPMTARQMLDQAGRAPVLGWAQDRRINLRATDVRKTWRKVQKILAQRGQAGD